MNQVQGLARDCLAANPFFTGVTMLLEYDPSAGADMLDQVEARFEGALAATGVVIVVLSPFAKKMDESKDGGLSLAVTVPVVFVENPKINRGAAVVANPTATPPITAVTPFGKPASQMLEEGMKALIKGFKFPDMPVQRPEIGKDGLVYYHLMPERRHVVRAL